MCKKILIVTAFPPNQRTAGQDYTRRLINDMLVKGHAIDLIYAEYPGHTVELPSTVNVLKTIKPSYFNCLKKISFHPFFTRRFNNNVMKFIKKIADKYDVLYFDFSQVHIYALFVEHPNKVMMCHDVIAQKFSRKIGWLNLKWIKNSERKTLTDVEMIVTFSEKDADLIKENYKMDAEIVNFYLKSDKYKYADKDIISNRFCLYGAWNRPENIEALEFYLKKVQPLLNCELQIDVIGGGMSDKLVDRLRNIKGMRYVGFVDDPVKYIASCQALIAPLHQGAGVKVKVVDALTCGTPVIGTDIAFEGLTDNNNVKLFNYANSAAELAECLDNWRCVSKDIKQIAADEFFDRYNTMHFTELL